MVTLIRRRYLHLGGGVKLHGARPERDHRVDERDVLVLQDLHVAHDVRLRVISEDIEKEKYRLNIGNIG